MDVETPPCKEHVLHKPCFFPDLIMWVYPRVSNCDAKVQLQQRLENRFKTMPRQECLSLGAAPVGRCRKYRSGPGGGTIGKVAHEITISMGGILNSSTRRSLMQCWHWRFFLSMTRVSFYMGKVLAQDVFGFAGKRLFFDVFDACLPKSCETNSNETNNHMMCSLVGGFKHFLFSIIYGIILPIDSYFSRWLKPPTRFMLFSLCFPFFLS